MLAAWALIVGGIVRIVGEIGEMLAGAHTAASGALAGIALLFVAIGIAGLWRDAAGSAVGRAGIGLVGVGALGFAGIAAWSVSVGTLPIGAIAQLPVFAAAAGTTLLGAVALLVWLIASAAYPRWIGVVMSVSIGLSLVSSFVALPALVQPLIDVVMAFTFIQLGLSMRERRKRGANAK